MPLPIEDYGIIGDLHTAALVGRDGSIDWLCLPRFDSGACFAALLGDADNGFWRIAPVGDGPVIASRRRYREGTLILETEFDTPTGSVRLIDFMPVREEHPQVVRIVQGLSGQVQVHVELVLRFGYGEAIPWVTRRHGLLTATAGPDAVALWTREEVQGKGLSTVADLTVLEGQQIPFTLTWFPSNEPPPRPVDPWFALATTDAFWRGWTAACSYGGEYHDAVERSLITLKALTFEPTGGIVAAATTSLPETLGGGRNWDYRYCWLRDATLTLESLMRGGYFDEAMAWRDWLLRATAGDPSKLQIMYGASGERRLDEFEVDWLSGYERSLPVRIGNAAAGQFQLDVYGEVMSALYTSARTIGVHSHDVWELQKAFMDFLEDGWKRPDDGIWEVRGPRRHFTHSKVMAWVAVDRAVRTLETWPELDGPIDRWQALRQEIHDEVVAKGYSTDKQAFTQFYGSDQLDASLLMIPLVGFLPPNDERVVSTIEAIERELMDGGFVLRYRTADDGAVDGLTGREGAFLACSFWLVDCLHMIGRRADARRTFERLLALRNDLGLLSEEYDSVAARQVGNFPQAFSHVSLVNSACRLTHHDPELESSHGAQRLRRALLERLSGRVTGDPAHSRSATRTTRHRLPMGANRLTAEAVTTKAEAVAEQLDGGKPKGRAKQGDGPG
ncbi:MAG TPA: glycoside hydrolase family 15 protein [Acidimicrobiales bacterium]|nr:glycoside hydrolase family 15 protein [Acidimicrobiales bacterium]